MPAFTGRMGLTKPGTIGEEGGGGRVLRFLRLAMVNSIVRQRSRLHPFTPLGWVTRSHVEALHTSRIRCSEKVPCQMFNLVCERVDWTLMRIDKQRRGSTRSKNVTRGLGIRAHLLGLLAIPLAGVLLIAGFGVSQGLSQVRESSELTDYTAWSTDLTSLAHDIQAERADLVSREALDPSRRSSIEAGIERIVRDYPVRSAEEASLIRRIELRTPGVDTTAATGRVGVVFIEAYSELIDMILMLSTQAANPEGIIDTTPASTVTALEAGLAAATKERDLLTVMQAGEPFNIGLFQKFNHLASAQEILAAQAAELATSGPTSPLQVDAMELEGLTAASAGIRAAAFNDITNLQTEEESAAATMDRWVRDTNSRVEKFSELATRAHNIAATNVSDFAAASRQLLALSAIVAGIILVATIFVLRRARRSIVYPLKDLAFQAEDVADNRLPNAVAAQLDHGKTELYLPAIRATGANEVRHVANAFNAVQETALQLASEQAALRANQSEAMTNLGRRNQTLLGRQLQFITDLEERETDPAFLEHLFKLDHLASRMRRNAESLLILAGSETPRHRRTPAKVTEIVRAAMGEVEDFERVRIGHLQDSLVVGPQVIDLIHMLAELIENALRFSPPESVVEIDGRPLKQGGYQFAIVDHGVGMTDRDLVAANHRMSSEQEIDGLPTKYLGQYVVAKLAKKGGAHVRLQKTSGGRGITALVTLSAQAIVERAKDLSASAPRPGSLAAREQGPTPYAPGVGLPSDDSVVIPDSVLVGGESTDDDIDSHDDAEISITSEISTDSEIGIDSGIGIDSEINIDAERTAFDELVEDIEIPEVDTFAAFDASDHWSGDVYSYGHETDVEPVADFAIREDNPLPRASSIPPAVPASPDSFTPPVNPLEDAPQATEPSPVVAPMSSGGGLQRRVPGAALKTQRPELEAQQPEANAPSRSADGVQSMLAALQHGRQRGLGTETAPSNAHTEPESNNDQLDDHTNGFDNFNEFGRTQS